LNRFRALQSAPGAVLFYHRVADRYPNPWTISPKNFLRHLNWLQTRFAFVSLEETLRAQQSGIRPEPTVHITFDDAYAENSEVAIPELLRRGIPVSYYVTTWFVESQIPFPHDVLRGIPLQPNTIDDIRRYASSGVTIGAHSHSHVDFGKPLSKAELRREIVDVRKKLQDWTGQSIDSFAFPYGLQENISQAAIDAVFEAGYQAFLSTTGGFNFPGGDDRHVQRIHGDKGMAALMNWLTFDPRKTMRPTPIRYTRPLDPQGPSDEPKAQPHAASTAIPLPIPVATPWSAPC
jgi:peptidoglycan/xylan/chitin deacetylase (PgdA/CDA1 family)